VGRTLFEVLPARPAAGTVPAGVQVTMLPRATTCLAYLQRAAGAGPAEEEAAVARWTALVKAGLSIIFWLNTPHASLMHP
jgi:hypothetical protein